MEPKKVVNAVTTFLSEHIDGLKIIKVATTKVEPEKVTKTVGTFLNENSDGLLKIKVTPAKTEPEKVTNTVGTFCISTIVMLLNSIPGIRLRKFLSCVHHLIWFAQITLIFKH